MDLHHAVVNTLMNDLISGDELLKFGSESKLNVQEKLVN